MEKLFLLFSNEMVWMDVDTKGLPPAPRHSHNCNILNDDLYRDDLYIFGGVGDGNTYNDLYVLETSKFFSFDDRLFAIQFKWK